MQPDHTDPFAEAHHRVLERVMALAAMTEAAARLTARSKERREELARQLRLDQAQLRQRLAGMPLLDVAKTWRTAFEQSKTDKNAGVVRTAAEAELRRRWPDLMGIYDEGIRQGLDPMRAMQAAGLRHAENLVWNEHPHLRHVYDDARKRGRSPTDAMAEAMASADARPHGGTTGWSADPAQRQAIGGSPAPLGREMTQVSQWMDPATRAQWLSALRETGADPAAVAWAEQLLADAGKQIAYGTSQAGQPDLRATPTIDEHTQGLNGAVVAHARGAHDIELAGAVAATPAPTAAATPAAAARPLTPVQLARLSFAERAELGLTQTTRPGAGKTIDGQVVSARPARQQTRGSR